MQQEPYPNEFFILKGGLSECSKFNKLTILLEENILM